MNILVIAKSPVAGRVKTRLCPPCTHVEAVALAEAALSDTLDAVTALDGAVPVLVLDGATGAWTPPDIRTIPQRGNGLAERLTNAFADAGGPAILIGMDTPQVTTDLLATAIDALSQPGIDALLGEADDGGWWLAGLTKPHAHAFNGVPMSAAHTGQAQSERFHVLGLRIARLPRLRDVDTFEDAEAVASVARGRRFAATFTDIAGAVASRLGREVAS